MEGNVDGCGGIWCDNVQGGVKWVATSHTLLQLSRRVCSRVLDDGQQRSRRRGCCSISAVRRVDLYLATSKSLRQQSLFIIIMDHGWINHNSILAASGSQLPPPHTVSYHAAKCGRPRRWVHAKQSAIRSIHSPR